jgi:hypothetical protein
MFNSGFYTEAESIVLNDFKDILFMSTVHLEFFDKFLNEAPKNIDTRIIHYDDGFIQC